MDDLDIDAAVTRLGEELIARILENDSAETILGLLESGSPVWYQNEMEGISPLHAAAFVQNAEVVKLLIEKGAVWNAVDYLKNTAGDIALSFNNAEIYTLIRDAGIRSELLLGLMGTHPLTDSSTLLFRATDNTASGSSDAFLKSKLRYKVEGGRNICVLDVDGSDIGVMMGWEENIMRETVQKLCLNHPKASGVKVLNIGFGLGIIDGLFQSLPSHPIQHVIIEAHPDVLQHMRETGWYDKTGVKILEGKWQDFIDSDDLLSSGGFDMIYTDTFSEDYNDLRQFFGHLPDLMADADSRFSFFNGLGATNPSFYDIYTHISDLHLANVGFHVDWSDIDVSLDVGEDRTLVEKELDLLYLYIYDRHCICVYYQDWHRTKRPKPAIDGGILPGVSQAVSPVVSTSTEVNPGLSSGFNSPRHTLSSTIGMNENSNQLSVTPLQPSLSASTISSTGLSFDEEAKLVYGVVISLRNMIKKLSGRDEQFVNYRTSAYKLHLFETLSGYKLVMLSDPKTDSLRFVLRQIYVGPFLEYVVRNPLLKMDSRQQGIDNEYFRSSVDRLIRALSVFA